jgi:hypothetical protein
MPNHAGSPDEMSRAAPRVVHGESELPRYIAFVDEFERTASERVMIQALEAG